MYKSFAFKTEACLTDETPYIWQVLLLNPYTTPICLVFELYLCFSGVSVVIQNIPFALK